MAVEPVNSLAAVPSPNAFPGAYVAYFVHNLSDAAVRKRIRMLVAAGCSVKLLGFCRDDKAPAKVEGAEALSIGQTFDANLGQRVQAVAKNIPRLAFWRSQLADADVIVARNLEMLLLAWIASKFSGKSYIVYESLDIHRSLLGDGFASRVLRALERFLVRQCRLVIYSSPAFWREYFLPMQQVKTPGLLVENKVLDLVADYSRPAIVLSRQGRPRTIGWFGNLRCRRTLDRLKAIADIAGGSIRILIAGKPSPAEFPDFATAVAHPFVNFMGSYTAQDLPELYAKCDFAWSIDYFEDGLNSSWLLPNRIYESSVYGTVPLALETVETGRWLAARKAGLLVSPTHSDADLASLLCEMTDADLEIRQAAVLAIPSDDLIAALDDCKKLAEAMMGGGERD